MAFKIGSLLFLLIFGSFVLARIYAVGPLVWLKRAALRSRALEGTDRRELVDRVRQLLPQANDGNVIFSLHRENSSSGGSNVSFALEKADIASVSSAGLFMSVQATDGTRYLLGTSWKKEFKSYLSQMGVPVQ